MLCPRCQATYLGPDGRCARCDAVPGPPVASYGSGLQYRLTPVQGIGLATVLLMGLMAVLYALRIVADIQVYNDLDEPLDDIFSDDHPLDEAQEGLYETLSVLMAIGGLALIPVFLVWFHRVRCNAEVWMPGRHRFSPGWAVGGWFVPVVNLWFPKQITDDILTATNPPAPQAQQGQTYAGQTYAGQPYPGYQGTPGRGLANAWWALGIVWLVMYFIGAVVLGNADDYDFGDLRTGMIFFLLGDLAALASAVCVLMLVHRISQTQDARMGAGYYAAGAPGGGTGTAPGGYVTPPPFPAQQPPPPGAQPQYPAQPPAQPPHSPSAQQIAHAPTQSAQPAVPAQQPPQFQKQPQQPPQAQQPPAPPSAPPGAPGAPGSPGA